MGDKVKLLSANCRGLRNKIKRYDVINYMKSKRVNILCLQDTHLTSDDEADLKSIWEGEILLHGVNTNSRGVAILLNNTFEYKIKNIFRDSAGNMIMLDFQLSDISVKLINIYGPNADDTSFYNFIAGLLNQNEEEYVLWCGDFNMIFNPTFDSHNYINLNNPRSRTVVMNMMEEYNLVDTFRYFNPEIKRFTWRRQNPLKQARLDYLIASSSFTDLVNKTDIIPGYRSDHSILQLDILLNKFYRGKGSWKFNTNLLKDINYLKLINECIQEEIIKYAVPVYNIEKINLINEHDIHLRIPDDLFLEMLILRMRGESVKFSSIKKRNENIKEKKLISEIQALEKNNDSIKQETLESQKA